MFNGITGNKSGEKNPLNPLINAIFDMYFQRTPFTSFAWFLFSHFFSNFRDLDLF